MMEDKFTEMTPTEKPLTQKFLVVRDDNPDLGAGEVFDSAADAGAYLRAEGFRSFDGVTDEDLFEIVADPLYSEQPVKPYWFAKGFADQAELDDWRTDRRA